MKLIQNHVNSNAWKLQWWISLLSSVLAETKLLNLKQYFELLFYIISSGIYHAVPAGMWY